MVVKRLMYTAFVAFLASTATIGILAYVTPRSPAALDKAVITPRELRRHASADDCWIVIDGAVYDVTAYIPLHPASPGLIASWCGKDATQAFATKGDGQPHSATAQAMLNTYLIGRFGKD